MANITPGQLGGFRPYGNASATLTPMRTAPRGLTWPARFAGSLLAGGGGGLSVSGHSYESAAAVSRRIIIMTQPPNVQVIYEFTTTVATGAFAFPNLAPGNYMVIDAMTDNSRRAQVYDWVVAA